MCCPSDCWGQDQSPVPINAAEEPRWRPAVRKNHQLDPMGRPADQNEADECNPGGGCSSQEMAEGHSNAARSSRINTADERPGWEIMTGIKKVGMEGDRLSKGIKRHRRCRMNKASASAHSRAGVNDLGGP